MDLAGAYHVFCTSTGAEQARASRLLMDSCLGILQLDREKTLDFFEAGALADRQDAEILLDYLIHCAETFTGGESASEAFGKETEPRGRPRNTERDRLIFEDIQRQMKVNEASVSKAVLYTQDNLTECLVEGLNHSVVLSASAIRTIYYDHLALREAAGNGELSESGAFSDAASPKQRYELLERLESEDIEVRRGAVKEFALRQRKVVERVLGSKLLRLFARTTGLEFDVMQYNLNLLDRLLQGRSPNEAFRWDDAPPN